VGEHFVSALCAVMPEDLREWVYTQRINHAVAKERVRASPDLTYLGSWRCLSVEFRGERLIQLIAYAREPLSRKVAGRSLSANILPAAVHWTSVLLFPKVQAS